MNDSKSKQLSKQKQAALKLLKQAAGAATKLTTSVEADLYCPKVIQQLDSTIGLLKSARKQLLAGHLHCCLEKRLILNKKSTIEELLNIYNLNS